MELRKPTEADIHTLKVHFNGLPGGWTYHFLINAYTPAGQAVLIALPELGGHEAPHLYLTASVNEFPVVADLVAAAEAQLVTLGYTIEGD